MSDFETADYFRNRAISLDPYPFFDYLRDQCPVAHEPHHNSWLVTGYHEAIEVYSDPTRFSSCATVSGPFTEFPVPLEGDDVSEIIEKYRDTLAFSDQLPSFDPPKHTAHRGLTMRLITPKRLKENEEFMWQLADRQIDEIIDKGECEFIADYARPFTLLVIADLLGVPESEHGLFRDRLANLPESEVMSHKPLEFLYEQFSGYIEDRRRNPRNDVMTGLATATFPDGSTPEVRDAALIAANLFAAGQETTVRLLSFALQVIADRRDIQDRLRKERDRVQNFIEETLRFESPLKTQSRMARVKTTVGDVELPAGAIVSVLPGAANRDPRVFENPDEFDIDRPNARQHLAFGHGIHTCLGAPLARAEGRVTVERLLERMTDIRLSEKEHGPPGDRQYKYLPTYFFRGLRELYLEFDT